MAYGGILMGSAAIAQSPTPGHASPFIPDDHACEGTSSVTYQIVQRLAAANTQADHALNQLYTLILRNSAPDP